MPPSRRRPFPFDMIWSGVGVMLARNAKGGPTLNAVKAQPLPDQPNPIATNQEQQPPVVELPHSWGDLSLGFGLSVDTPEMDSHKYSHTIGADASLGGFIMKGPLITTCTPATRDTTNGITEFIEFPNGSLLAMNGRYVHRRVSDNTVTGFGASPVKDFGAGVNCINAAIHQSDGGTPANPTVYAAMNGANVAQYCSDSTGVTWTAFSTHVSIAYWTVGRELWRASDVNQASKCDQASDPTVEASWANAASFRIGDKQYPINRVRVSSVGFPLFMKQDGLYTLDTVGQDSRLYPWFQFGASSEDGLFSWDFGNDTHVTYGNQHVRLTPTEGFSFPRVSLVPTGPERSLGNTSEVHGRLTAGVGDGSMFAYVGLYNPDTNTSYLLKFSGWIGAEIMPGKFEEAQRIDAWHGSISQPFVGKKITAMHRSRTGAGAYVKWSYKTSTAQLAFTSLTDSTGTDVKFDVTPLKRADVQTGTSSYLADLKLTLHNTFTSLSPVVTTPTIHYSVVTPVALRLTGVIDATTTVRRDGRPMRLSSQTIRSLIKSAANAQTGVTITLPDGSTKTFSVINYGEQLAWSERTEPWSSLIPFEIVEYNPNQTDTGATRVNGIIANLAPYTVADLAVYTIADLELL